MSNSHVSDGEPEISQRDALVLLEVILLSGELGLEDRAPRAHVSAAFTGLPPVFNSKAYKINRREHAWLNL